MTSSLPTQPVANFTSFLSQRVDAFRFLLFFAFLNKSSKSHADVTMRSQLLLPVCIGQRMTGCIVPRALWAAKKVEAEKKRKDESNAVGQQPGGEVVSQVAGLAARLPLLLLLPLLRSQAKASPELREEVADLLLSSLIEVGDKQALAAQCLQELAVLLTTWLEESSSSKVASALVAVSSCQPVSAATLVSCIHLLNQLELPSLPVAGLLQQLSKRRGEERTSGEPSQSTEECSLTEIKDSLTIHLGHLATQELTKPNRIRDNQTPGHMERILDLLEDAIGREVQPSIMALLMQLRTDLTRAEEHEECPRLKTQLWSLLESTNLETSQAASHTLLAAVTALWPNRSDQADLVLQLLQQDRCSGKSHFLDLLLMEWAAGVNSGKPLWREQAVEENLLSCLASLDQDTIRGIASTRQADEPSEGEAREPTAKFLGSPSSKLRYLAALQGRLMAEMLERKKKAQSDESLSAWDKRADVEDDSNLLFHSWCSLVFLQSQDVFQELKELIMRAPEAREEVEEKLKAGFLGEITLPLVTVLSAVVDVNMCTRLVEPLVSFLLQAHDLLGTARDPAAEDLQESLSNPRSTEGNLGLLLDLTLTIACVVSRWLKILHMPLSSSDLYEPYFVVLLEKGEDQKTCVPTEVIEHLWKLPVLRPSLKNHLQVDRLGQELHRVLQGLGEPALAEASSQFSALLRSLQAGAEVEGRWEEAVCNVRRGLGSSIVAEMAGDPGKIGELRKLCELLFGREWVKRREATQECMSEKLASHLEEEGGLEALRGAPKDKEEDGDNDEEKETVQTLKGDSKLPRTAALVSQILDKLSMVQAGALAALVRDPEWNQESLDDNLCEEKPLLGGKDPEQKIVNILFSFLESSYSIDDLKKVKEKRAKRGKLRSAALVQTSRLTQATGLMGLAARAIVRGVGLEHLDRGGRKMVLDTWSRAVLTLVEQVNIWDIFCGKIILLPF